jgi:hypothetical protein
VTWFADLRQRQVTPHVFSEDDRWHVINYARATFGNSGGN